MINNKSVQGDAVGKQRLASVLALLLWCAGLLTYRGYIASHSYGNGDKSQRLDLYWNLLLAALPLLWSSAFQAADARKRPALAAAFFCLWLLFLPNAPYLLTDVLHLRPSPHVPLWYLLAVLLSCAGTGTMLGYPSLLQVHAVVERTGGAKGAAWAAAVASLMLCGFGIYLGCVSCIGTAGTPSSIRCDFWTSIAAPSVSPGSPPRPLAVTLVFGIGRLLGYLVLRVFSAPPAFGCGPWFAPVFGEVAVEALVV